MSAKTPEEMTPAEFAAWKRRSEEKIQQIREEAAAIRRESDEIRRETDEIRRESEAIRRETDEIRREREETTRRLEEQIAKTDAQIAATDAQIAKTDAQIAKVAGQLGGWTNNANEQLEAEFIEALAEAKQIGDIALDGVRGPLKNKFEYDVFGNNCDSVVVGEIKRKLLPEDVRRFAEERLPYFAENFPAEAAGRKVFGMVAGETIVPDAEAVAKECGLFVLRLKNKKLVVANAEGARAVN